MSTPKGKIPRANHINVNKIALGDTDWGGIEEAYGSVISPEVRTLIVAATNGFIREVSAEKTGRMEDAFGRANRLHGRAQALINAINERSPNDVTRQYVDDEISLSNERLSANNTDAAPRASRVYVVEFLRDLNRFSRACELTLQEFNYASQYNYWRDGAAWGKWVRNLTRLAKASKLRIGARKDMDKNSRGKASPFVELICALQHYIPAEYVPKRTNDALATAINRARSESKTNFPLKKPRSTGLRRSRN
jgi:hypothetical protein